MTMTTDGLTAREHAEALEARYQDSQNRIEVLGDRATPDEVSAHMALGDEFATAVAAAEAEAVEANRRSQAHSQTTAAMASLEGLRQRVADAGTAEGLDLSSAFGTAANAAPARATAVVAEEYTAALKDQVKADGSWKGGDDIPVLRDFNMFGPGRHMNIVTADSATSAGATIEPQHLPGIVDQAQFRPLTVLDLFTQMSIDSDSFDWVEIASKTNNAAFVAEATSAGGLASAGHTDAVTDAAGGLKPFSSMTLEKKTAVLELVAHLEAITMKAASFAPQMMTILDTFLREGLRVEIEDQALFGDGTSPNLRGVFNTTTPYTLNTFDMSTNSVTDRLVAVAQAIALVQTTAREVPTALLVNPLDWYSEDFALSQDGQQQFRLGNPFGTTITNQSLWGLRVVLSEAVPQGTQYLGDFSQVMYATRGGTMVEMSRSHSDWFARNLLALRAEQYAGLGVRKPLAICAIVA